jgi:hypothetical protein
MSFSILTTLFGPYVAPLFLHVVGDYITQSDWMANQKTKSVVPAAAHALVYTLPFLLLTQSLGALFFILATHFIIDHLRLARYICWAKNFMAPKAFQPKPWKDCQATGYNPETPSYMAVWLMIITDNTLHILCNAYALTYLQ